MADLLPHLQAALGERYAIEREVGRGAMATVYLALDLKHDRRVAIKVLRPELTAVLGVQRFLREITIVAGLTHPHILPLHDSGAAGELLYYVMPFVEGESLRDRLTRERQLSIEDAIRIARDVADALSYAHSRDIVHRDIKPENVLLEAGHAVVTDFGIARAISAAGGERLTEMGIAVGTPVYMSPEQATAERVIGGRSDIYSLACVLYEMLAGEPPFGGASAQAIRARHALDPVPPLRTVRKAVPLALEQAIEKALAKVPADRFATAAEFADAAAQAVTRAARPVAMWRAVALALGMAVVAGGAWWLLRLAARPTGIQSLAVLPFANLTGDRDQEYFVEGVHDAVIGELAQISALTVISRTSVIRYRDSKKSVPEIARDLHVDALVEGSVSRASDSVRIQVQLIRAVPSERHLWQGTYDGDLRGVLALQKRVARTIADQIQARILPSERARLAAARPVDPAAYDAWARGRFQHTRLTEESLRKCLQFAETARRIDTNYAAAYALSAACYNVLPFVAEVPPRDAFPKAKLAALQALKLDSTLADAHLSLAWTLAVYDWDWTGADREYRRALELRPGASAYGWFLAWLGRFDEAIAAVKRAQQFNPVGPQSDQQVAAVLWAARRYPEAIAEARRAIETDSAYVFGYDRLGRAYTELGMYDEAITAFQHAVALSGGATMQRSNLARAFALSGRTNEARRTLADLERLALLTYVQPTHVAQIHAALGEKDAALEWLERGYRARDGDMVLLKVWPAFDPLRAEARFQSLLRRMKFPD